MRSIVNSLNGPWAEVAEMETEGVGAVTVGAWNMARQFPESRPIPDSLIPDVPFELFKFDHGDNMVTKPGQFLHVIIIPTKGLRNHSQGEE